MEEGSGSRTGTGRGARRGTGRGTGRRWETETETDTRTAREIVIDLFGERDVPVPSSRYFDAYFGPPPPPPRPQDPGQERPPESSRTTEEEVPEWKKNTHFYFDGDMVPPFQYSSSIEYGGREYYKLRNKPAEEEPVFSTFSEHGLEDGYATRGDWWRGSYHY